MFWLLFCGCLVAFCAGTKKEMSDLRRNVPAFLFIYPKKLLAGKNETICLNLHEANVPAKALIDLKIKDKHHSITKMMHSEHSCFELPVPQHRSSDILSASLHLQLQLNGTIHSSHNQDAILIYPNADVTFIETDKGMYKQGDMVQIRLLVLGYNLKATKKHYVSSVRIINPSGFTVAVWDKLSLQMGLAQIEYLLADETMLGKWKIECNDVSKSFQVKTYVLPRFKVSIFYPKTVYSESETVIISVCARYSYGKYVHGTALLKISFPEPTYEAKNKIKTLQNGCTTFELHNDELNLHSISLSYNMWNLNIIATVTEEGSNRVETDTTKVKITKQAYELKFSEETAHFQPGLPFKSKLKMLDSQLGVNNEYVEICYYVAVRKPWNIKPEECRNFTFDEERTISFSILPVKDNIIEINLIARSINYSNIQATMTLHRWYSPSNSFISIGRNIKGISKCKSLQQYTIHYTTNKFKSNENVTFYYMLKSRTDVLQMRKIQHRPRRQIINFMHELQDIVGTENKFTRAESYVDKFVLKFKLNNNIISKSKLLVFYITNDETVAASIDIYVEKCLPNTVTTNWSESKLYPGEAAFLSINTRPNSLCAVSVTDKANTFISNSKPLSVANILQPFLQEKLLKVSYKPNCLVNQKRKLDSLVTEPNWDLRRRKRSFTLLTSNDYDTYEVLNDVGLSYISNMKMIQKPCDQNLPPQQFQLAENIYEVNSDLEYDILEEDRGISIRSHFPETWLWELVPIGYVPHTITTWLTNTICVSPEDGVGIAPTQEITIFQPFFLDILTPYSIKYQEIVHMQVILFNYLNYSLPIRITLGDTIGMQLLDEKNDYRTVICVKPDETYTHHFRAKATTMGRINLTVLAEIDSSFPSECGPEVIINKRDVVYKSILVVPEGYLMEFVNSTLLCGDSENSNVTWTIDLPDTIIGMEENVKVIINSDLLGPTIQNLEKLLNIPTGCGEQVMATMAPNLYILRYLKSNNKLTNSIQQRAIKNIKIGYQRILDHAHKDGSFSAFGFHDPAGSMFLTAFVVRTLQQAKEYTYVDDKIIQKAIRWITANQLENGCFASVSHVFQDMGGTSTENSTAALTAYVIISLLESNIELSETVRTNAMYCIRGHNTLDKYTLAINTYALYLINWHNQANLLLKRLLDVATNEGGLIWWSNPAGSSSENIEMTAYALMALMYEPNADNLIQASAIVRWLATQRGTQGGFVTTQDTVVALDAISRYATIVKDKAPDLLVKICGADESFDVKMDKSDRLKSKQVAFASVPDDVSVRGVGEGCVLAQLFITYYVDHQMSSEAFKLTVSVNEVSTIDKCSVAIISPCVSYTGVGVSNMAVLEVNLLSGYEPDRASLHLLTDNQKVKKFEEFKDKIVLYFTKLGNDPACVPFKINENVMIDDQADGVIKLFDYYNPKLEVYTTYNVSKCQSRRVKPISLLPGTSKNNVTHGYRIIDEYPESAKEDEDVPISKRDLNGRQPKYGFNRDFVNMDVEMATPSGLEGNLPTFMKPEKTKTN